jgi:hypothetical protein
MASKDNSFLNQLLNGLLGPKGQLSTWEHASRTFQDDYFRLAPKAKFLYHVYFDINTSALKTLNLKFQHQTEMGLLVKSADLPRFILKTSTLNQYNRKKVVMTDHEFQPINLKFHDDRSHIVNALWQNYYAYYFADSYSAKSAGAYSRTAMKNGSYIRNKYGLDNGSSIPFFRSITLYQLNKREYVSYTLVNPMITSFNHDQVQSNDQGTNGAECSMTLAYEAVHYDIGSIRSGRVKGFAVDHYDKAPSPLTPQGGGTASLFGAGGVIEGAADVFGALASGEAFNSPANFLSTAITAINTYQNSKKLSKVGVQQEGRAIVTAGAIAVAAAGVSGLRDIIFPGAGGNNRNRPTVATQVNF